MRSKIPLLVILLTCLAWSCSSRSTPLPPTPTSLPTTRPYTPTQTPSATAIPPTLTPTPTTIPSSTPTFTPSPTPTPTATGPFVPPSSDGEIAFVAERDGLWQIMVMKADGSGETSLTKKYGEYSNPAWSPDGESLAMRKDISSGTGIAIMKVQEQGGKLVGSQPVALTDTFDDAPSWSPDGQKLVFASAPVQNWQISQINADGSSPAVAVPGIPEGALDPDWSPDGQRILYSYDPAGGWDNDIYVINIDGSGLTQLTQVESYDGEPIWSPSGSQIVFVSSRNGSKDIYIMDADGSNIRRLTTNPADEFDPSWSPDSTRIAFVSDRHGNYEIYLINADGSNEMRLTYNRTTERWPVWRPGSTATGQQDCKSVGKYLADITIPDGTQFTSPQSFDKVWRVENKGDCTWTAGYELRFVEGDQMGEVEKIRMPGAIQPGATADLVVPLTAPSSPGKYTGKWHLFDAEGQAVPGPSGKLLTLTVVIEVLSPSRAVLPSPLYFLRDQNGVSQIWRMDVDGQTLSQIIQETAPIYQFDVSPADGALAYITQDQLILADQDGQDKQVLASAGEDKRPNNPVWSPDGSQLAYGLGGLHVYTPASGEDRLILANVIKDGPGTQLYAPLSWSPDGTLLLINLGYYEGNGWGILSIEDGTFLVDFAPAEMQAWSTDSQTLFLTRATSPGMMDLKPGLLRIAAQASAELKILVDNRFVWWPKQTPNLRLLYFMGSLVSENPQEFSISLYAADADGSTNRQNLRSDIMLLEEGNFPEALWAVDASAVILRLTHPYSSSDELILLRPDGKVSLFLMQDAHNLRWGK